MKILIFAFILSVVSIFSSSFHTRSFELCSPEKIYATNDYLYGESFFKEYEKVKKFPEYPGGLDGIQKFFDENVKLSGEATSIVARYHVTFIVNCKGETGNFELKSKPFPGHEEILNACRKMPLWKPTEVKGEKVDCYVRLGFTNQAGKLRVDYREK